VVIQLHVLTDDVAKVENALLSRRWQALSSFLTIMASVGDIRVMHSLRTKLGTIHYLSMSDPAICHQPTWQRRECSGSFRNPRFRETWSSRIVVGRIFSELATIRPTALRSMLDEFIGDLA
jgi:hypothetical protein